MKTQTVLPFFLILTPFVSGDESVPFSIFSSRFHKSEQTVIGRLSEDVILPCSFESGPKVVIHWKIQDSQNVHIYYKDSDHLEKQDPRYVNRTSLFHSEIHNGNASLLLKHLKLQDEGIYICYVGTDSGTISNKVVLMVGAFLTPAMKYEKVDKYSFLTCHVLNVYPRSIITWQVDNTPVSKSTMDEIGYLPPFYNKSMLNITGSNSSYECVIENSLLKQIWTGRWTMGDHLQKRQSQEVSLSCHHGSNFYLPNQDFIVTWSRVENGTSSVLASFLSISRNTIINEPRFSWSKELINQSDFSSTLSDLNLSDNGEYICNISSGNYTFLTVQTLNVEPMQKTYWEIICVILLLLVVFYGAHKWRKGSNSSRGRRSGFSTDERDERERNAASALENMPLQNMDQNRE
ncbi:HERV-H LTR-associating protein 2 [Dasypus novemcinctus]|uniref:HERV-H LTR-associating protein 2 n=1 Tax=Dasypus novemcinctus TaxID=9361 RepID=UPI0003CBFE82|nr:HERV-H LTR-associating protein 2 [Dasypus novemcinctus]